MRPLVRPFLLATALVAVSPQEARPADRKAMEYTDNGHVILDPAYASQTRLNDERLIVSILDCLTVLDPQTGRAGPGAAERWDVSEDRHTWTFHLSKKGVWTDDSPVTAHDFVRAWKRVMDPFKESPWTAIYRPIKGCAGITDNSARATGFAELRRQLRQLKRAHPNGIPGDRLILLLEETGVTPYLHGIRSRSVSRMLKWKPGDLFPPEMVDKVLEALKEAKSEVKDVWEGEFNRFGKAGSGVHAPDDHTLVVKTNGDVPYLAELVARSAFAPLHKKAWHDRDKHFEAANYITNGPFLLRGRGAHPPDDQPEKRVLSVVHLVKNPKYAGPAPAKLDEIKCYTDQGLEGLGYKVDLRQFEDGTRQWVNMTWPDGVPSKPKKVRGEIEKLPGFTVRPAPLVLYMRFRCDRPPFNNVAARKAFALAFDRQKLADAYWPKAVPAFRIVPPAIDGREEGVQCPKPDLGAAKSAFQQAGMDSETWVELSYGETPGQYDVASGLVQQWKKVLAMEPGTRIESAQDVRRVTRSGNFYAMLSIARGAVNDPHAYLGPLHSGDVDSGHGWRDKATDALLDGARDPDVALADPKGWLKRTGHPHLESALKAAKGSQEGRERFRRAALAAAEQRLMSEYVVVPMLYIRDATLIQDLSGLGSDEAYANPGFVGSLRSATR
jgi:ABC-type oligopeptide transport system substrate-binding subunit